MAAYGFFDIYSNDGLTLLFTNQTNSFNPTFSVTSTGVTDGSNTYVYEGNKKFLGVSTSSGTTEPTYPVGSEFTVSLPTMDSVLKLYIVEGIEPTTADYLQELINQKKALANNLVEKGIEATEDEKFNTLVPKVLDIETGVTPTGEIGITDNGTYNVTEYESANVNVPKGVPIEIDSLDSSLLVKENEGKVYKYNDKLYRIVNDEDTKSLIDLTSATVTVPAGWTASAGYGEFNILGGVYLISTGKKEYDFWNTTQKNFLIGYQSVGSPASDSIYYLRGENSGICLPGGIYKRIYKITGGVDVTNQSLIQWFIDNNATITGGTYEYSSFIFQEILSPDGELAITENGSYDVTNYKTANVNVPIPDGYIKPEGEVEIVENGTYDVTNYSSANVNIPVIEEYDGSVIIKKPIIFIINSIEHQAEDGMTWEEYCNSEYNTYMIVVDTMIVNGGGQQLIDSSNKTVNASDLIIADATYQFSTSGGA